MSDEAPKEDPPGDTGAQPPAEPVIHDVKEGGGSTAENPDGDVPLQEGSTVEESQNEGGELVSNKEPEEVNKDLAESTADASLVAEVEEELPTVDTVFLESDYEAVVKEILDGRYSDPEYSVLRHFSRESLQDIETQLYNAYYCVKQHDEEPPPPIEDPCPRNRVFLESDYAQAFHDIFTKYTNPNYSVLRHFSRLTLQLEEERLYNSYYGIHPEGTENEENPDEPNLDDCVCPRARYTDEEAMRVPKELTPKNFCLTELKRKEIKLIIESWTRVRKDMKMKGPDVFIECSTEIPGFTDLFKETTDDENTNELADFVISSIGLICAAISAIKRPTLCTRLLHMRGFLRNPPAYSTEHLMGFKCACIEAIKKSDLEAKKDTLEVWCKFLAITFGIMDDATKWDDRGER